MIDLKYIYTLQDDLEKGLAQSIQSSMTRSAQEYMVAIINKMQAQIDELGQRLSELDDNGVTNTKVEPKPVKQAATKPKVEAEAAV